VEDPIEFVHESKSAGVTSAKCTTDTSAFPKPAFSPANPGIILVGEMRDETLSICSYCRGKRVALKRTTSAAKGR
jgi:Tfp pilus assembly pilus retraction ATPase PilT